MIMEQVGLANSNGTTFDETCERFAVGFCDYCS